MTPTPWKVERDFHSDRLASFVGRCRQGEADRLGLSDAHGLDGGGSGPG